MKKTWETIEEKGKSYICSNCGNKWSIEHNTAPIICECQYGTKKIKLGDEFYNPLTNAVLTADENDDLEYINEVSYKVKDSGPVMIEFLVTQIILDEVEKRNACTQIQKFNSVSRVVLAANKEEALGRFILETANVIAIQKLDPQVDVLADVIRLKP